MWETRAECRQLVLAYVDEVVNGLAEGDDAEGDGASSEGASSDAVARRVTLDLSGTQEVDASGLGILVLAHKRAREHGVVVCLRSAPEPVRRLLVLTKLDYLFEYVE